MTKKQKQEPELAPEDTQLTEIPQPDNSEQTPKGEAPTAPPVPGLAHADEYNTTLHLGIGNVPQALVEPEVPVEPAPIVQNANDVIHSAPEIVHAGLAKDVGGAPLPNQPQRPINGDRTLESRLSQAAYEVVRAYHISKGKPDTGDWLDQTTDTQRAVTERIAAELSGVGIAPNGSTEDALVLAVVNAMKQK